MAFLVADVDDFLVAATDDFLVTADDTVPGTGIGFDNVTVGPTLATWARLGSADLSKARVGSAVIWEELVAPAIAPGSAYVDVVWFAPTVTAIAAISIRPGTGAMAVSGLTPQMAIFSPGATVTLMAPGGTSLTSPVSSAALPGASGEFSFVFDY